LAAGVNTVNRFSWQRGKVGRVNGHLISLLTLMKSQPLAYNKDNQEDKEPLFDTVDTVLDSLRAFADMLPAIQPNTAAMREAALRGFSTATDLADYLVANGVAFRDAHEVVGEAVALAANTNRPLEALSVEELKAWKGNPLDLLEPIANAKIPLRHAVCLNDAVVPPKQNSIAAKQRLQELGHDLDLVVVEHSDLLHGHHFPMPEVFESSRFVMQHASVMPADDEYYTLRAGLSNSIAAFESRKTGRVAFLGGSITYNPGWRDELMRYFRKRFPETEFDFINFRAVSRDNVFDLLAFFLLV